MTSFILSQKVAAIAALSLVGIGLILAGVSALAVVYYKNKSPSYETYKDSMPESLKTGRSEILGIVDEYLVGVSLHHK